MHGAAGLRNRQSLFEGLKRRFLTAVSARRCGRLNKQIVWIWVDASRRSGGPGGACRSGWTGRTRGTGLTRRACGARRSGGTCGAGGACRSGGAGRAGCTARYSGARRTGRTRGARRARRARRTGPASGARRARRTRRARRSGGTRGARGAGNQADLPAGWTTIHAEAIIAIAMHKLGTSRLGFTLFYDPKNPSVLVCPLSNLTSQVISVRLAFLAGIPFFHSESCGQSVHAIRHFTQGRVPSHFGHSQHKLRALSRVSRQRPVWILVKSVRSHRTRRQMSAHRPCTRALESPSTCRPSRRRRSIRLHVRRVGCLHSAGRRLCP